MVWITDNDEPIPMAKFATAADWRTECRKAWVRARDAQQLEVELIPCLIPRAVDGQDEPVFDVNKFYADVFSHFLPAAELDGMVRELPDPFDGMEDKTTQLVSHKRAAFTVPFEIAPGTTIGVQGCVGAELSR